MGAPDVRVFAQTPEPRVDVEAWQRQAERFFATKLEVGGAAAATMHAVTLVLPGGARSLRGRARADRDLREALEAESAHGFTGLYGLAERCPTVWCIERSGPDDHVALLVAAVLASVVLGPILADGELFGVRTARAKLTLSRS
jgi:hypothetical protein